MEWGDGGAADREEKQESKLNVQQKALLKYHGTFIKEAKRI